MSKKGFFSFLNEPVSVKAPEKRSAKPVMEESRDFRTTMPWRVFRIMAEFVEGWEFLADHKRSVSIFGSARMTPDNEWYKEAEKMGRLLAKEGFHVVTGGGPGIMEGGNRGAAEAKGISVGLNIKLPNEQELNPFVNRSMDFHYFFTRKLMLTYASAAYVYFPGGFGTLDEFFEMVTLVQTKKIPQMPIILVGKDYWSGFLKWLENDTLRNDLIGKEDLKIFSLVDSAEEAMKIVKKAPAREQYY